MKSTIKYKGEAYFEDQVPVYLNMAHGKDEQHCTFHSHDFIEIAYVKAGKGYHSVGSERYPVLKGDISIINRDVPHAFICNDGNEKELVIYNCVFMPEFLDYSLLDCNDFKDIASSILFNSFFIEDRPAINLRLSGFYRNEMEEIFNKMLMEYLNTPKGYKNVLRSYLVELLTKIFRFMEIDAIKYDTVNSRKHGIILKTLDFIKSNYSSAELSLNEIAIKAFLSKSYLSKLFKEVTGQNLSEYLQNLRISEACGLLKTTDKKISDIMEDVGFKDLKHFNRLFKRITGTTPSVYRKR